MSSGSFCDRAARALEKGTPATTFVQEVGEICKASTAERQVFVDFYEQCQDLHRDGLDGLWPYVLRNAFMPAFIGDFDLVVGNPPWVNWESLPAPYRERTRELWKRYGLFVHGGMAAMLGAGKKDVSMLMAYVATDKLLRPDGHLGFVITQTVFKTAGAGQGFRRFRIGDAGPLVRVEHVDDMTDVKPFVGAANRTALLTWRKDEKTRYPVKYVLWQRRPQARLPEDSTLDEVMAKTTRRQLVAAPVSSSDPTSAWLSLPRKLIGPLRKLAETGTPAYVAHEGVNTGGANGVYWVSVDGGPDAEKRVPITNLHDIGKTRIEEARARRGGIGSPAHPRSRRSSVARPAFSRASVCAGSEATPRD